MKKVFLALGLLVSSHAMFAQINKGQWLVGGNVSFDAEKQGDYKVSTFEFNPNAGYFFINNFAGGLRLGYTSEKVKGGGDAYTYFGAAPFLRYYFLPAAQKVNVFADGSYGFAKEGSSDKRSGNMYSIMAGPAIFLSPNTALEFALYYKSYGGDAFKNSAGDRDNHFGVNIGFRIHLGGK